MREIVFFSILALCLGEQGYQYGQSNPAGLGGFAAEEHQTGDHYQDHADYHKHFYAFEAPYDSDSDEEVQLVEQKIADVAQKNLQVVFIKAPENKAVLGALNALTKQSSEDKTAIYVLNKQTDSNELASKLSALQAHHKHKPQVHFVKYRTDAEAARAQQHIQEQYAAAGALPQEQPLLQPLPQPLPQPQPLPAASLGYLQSGYVLGKDSQAAQAYSPSSSSSSVVGYTQASYTPAVASPASSIPASSSSLGYSQQDYTALQLPPAPPAYYAPQSTAEQTTQQTLYPPKITAPPAYYAQVAPAPQVEPALPPVAPLPTYLPPVSNFVTPPPISYNPGLIDLPPVPLVEQQLAPSPYDLDARSARSRHHITADFRVNERHRAGSRIAFPTSTPARSYLPPISRSYLPPQKRRKRAHSTKL